LWQYAAYHHAAKGGGGKVADQTKTNVPELIRHPCVGISGGRRRAKTGPKDFLASILKQKDQKEWLLNVWRRSWHYLLKRIADKEQKEINSLSPFVRGPK